MTIARFAIAGSLAVCLLPGCLLPGRTPPGEHRGPWLELPRTGTEVGANSSASLTQDPSQIQRIVLHIPPTVSRIPFGSIHAKVNTEAADMAMKTASTYDGILVDVDLADKSGFPMQPGRNSVELEYQDDNGRRTYCNFVLDFPAPAAGHRGITAEPTREIPDKRKGRLFAVVIGVSHFSDPSQKSLDLKFADRDAQSVYDFLRSPAGGGVAPSDALLLLNQDATTASVHRALFEFLAKPLEQDTVIIYLAGHGAPDPHDPRTLYFLTADTNLNDMVGTSFPMYELQQVFARVLKAKRVLTFADTCHGYGFTGALAGRPPAEENNLINQYIEHYAGIGQRAVITASDIGESSLEDAKWGDGHGVFTYYLLRGLSGEADRNRDRVVTAGEIFAYLQQKVPAATSGHQNPRAIEGLASALAISTVAASAKGST